MTCARTHKHPLRPAPLVRPMHEGTKMRESGAWPWPRGTQPLRFAFAGRLPRTFFFLFFSIFSETRRGETTFLHLLLLSRRLPHPRVGLRRGKRGRCRGKQVDAGVRGRGGREKEGLASLHLLDYQMLRSRPRGKDETPSIEAQDYRISQSNQVGHLKYSVRVWYCRIMKY